MTLPIASLSHHGFWSSTAGVALVVALCALVVGGTVALMLMRRFKRASVRDRVGQFVSSELATPTEVVEDALRSLPPRQRLAGPLQQHG